MIYIIGSAPDLGGKDIIVKMNEDKKNFIMNGDKSGISACRVLIGEVQRDPDKDYSDEKVTETLRMVRKQTLKNPEPDYLILQLIDTYIKPMISDYEVEAWLSQNYSTSDIANMGKGAYRIIGEAKKQFKDEDFNSDIITKIIKGVLDGIV